MILQKNNLLSMSMAFILIAMPMASCAMDQDTKPKNIMHYPIAAANVVKDGAVYALQTAYEHPKVTICAGTVLVGFSLYKYLFATQRDLIAAGDRMTAHRNLELQRVTVLKSKHDKEIQEKFGRFGTRQTQLVALMTQTQGDLEDSQDVLYDIILKANKLGLNHTTLIAALRTANNNVAQQAQQEIDALNDIDVDARVILAQQQGTRDLSVLVFKSMGGAQDDLQHLVAHMRENGQDLTVIEQQVRTLIEQAEARNAGNNGPAAEGAQVEQLPDEN